ncbi:VOC family protein [Williamsia deligens]|uniref:VOC family protein n=1 Tax=Williamsia deligens TaxID=321325 RepID=A0ABW3GAJ1_9NOCA|nr:VOC family protein [Williamsia deligens]
MARRAHFLTFATADLDAARRFYIDGLGWEPLLDVAGEIVFFQVAGGFVLGLFQAEKFAADVAGATATAIGGTTIAHNVDSRDDVHTVVDRMAGFGGTVVTPPEDGAFGGIFHAIVRDPNGVVWEVAHNPGFSVDADGTVHLG